MKKLKTKEILLRHGNIELYTRFKSMAARLGIPGYKAIEEAMLLWVNQKKQETEGEE